MNRCFGVKEDGWEDSDAQYADTPIDLQFERIWVAGAGTTCGRLLNGSDQLFCWYYERSLLLATPPSSSQCLLQPFSQSNGLASHLQIQLM
jgi:hypothetical protein